MPMNHTASYILFAVLSLVFSSFYESLSVKLYPITFCFLPLLRQLSSL
jgi:hypothetical protein